jgi:AbrB family looped-hinge helix DNA binding protein
MARVTSKRQLTLPKAIADRYGIRPGDDLELIPSREGVRMLPPGRQRGRSTADERLASFDAATDRQKGRSQSLTSDTDRGWRRDDLYRRGRTD